MRPAGGGTNDELPLAMSCARDAWPTVPANGRSARLSAYRRLRSHGANAAMPQNVSVVSLAEHAAAVGLRLSVQVYPAGGAVRDGAQLRYIDRFLSRVSDSFLRELEAVIPLPGDFRAIDIVLRAPGCLIAVEVITRLHDIQAQLRLAQAKARDIGATRLIMAVAATHANRRALDQARPALATAWDLDTRRVMTALGAGRQPDRNAVVLI